MSIRKQATEWAKRQTEGLRSDPKAWARTQTDRLKSIVEVEPFSDAALERTLTSLRERMARLEKLDTAARETLADELLELHERISTGGALVSGAKIGLAASVLPVVGVITGPLLGGAYGVYRSQRLGKAREEIQEMMRDLARR